MISLICFNKLYQSHFNGEKFEINLALGAASYNLDTSIREGKLVGTSSMVASFVVT
jgi:hypothetical protein